jgi:hypothetical protein
MSEKLSFVAELKRRNVLYAWTTPINAPRFSICGRVGNGIGFETNRDFRKSSPELKTIRK